MRGTEQEAVHSSVFLDFTFFRLYKVKKRKKASKFQVKKAHHWLIISTILED